MTPSPSPTSLAASFSFFLRFFASFALSNRVHVTTCAYVRLLRGSLALCFFPARSLSGRAEMKTFWRFRLCEATFCSQARGDVRGEGRTARLSLLPLFFHLLQRSLLFFFCSVFVCLVYFFSPFALVCGEWAVRIAVSVPYHSHHTFFSIFLSFCSSRGRTSRFRLCGEGEGWHSDVLRLQQALAVFVRGRSTDGRVFASFLLPW